MYFGYNMRGVSRHFRKEEPTLRNGQQKNIRRDGSVRAAVEVARWLWMGGVVVRVRVVRAWTTVWAANRTECFIWPFGAAREWDAIHSVWLAVCVCVCVNCGRKCTYSVMRRWVCVCVNAGLVYIMDKGICYSPPPPRKIYTHSMKHNTRTHKHTFYMCIIEDNILVRKGEKERKRLNDSQCVCIQATHVRSMAYCGMHCNKVEEWSRNRKKQKKN